MAKTLMLGFMATAMPLLSAQAAPATSEEAARLTALFERYVGHPAPGDPGSVTVVPKGESYVVTFDLKRALAGLESFGLSMDPNTSATVLTPRDDGTWKVASDSSPPMVMHAGQQTITFKSATSTFDGIYDPKLFAFRESKGVYTGYDYAQTAPNLVQDRRIDRVDLDLKSIAAEGGTVSMLGHYLATGTAADIMITSPPPAAEGPGIGNPAVPPPPVRPGTPISYASPSSTIDVGAERLHVKDILDVWAFLVAHPNRDSLTAAADDFKTLVRAGLPFAETAMESAAFDSFAVTTPIGPFSVHKLAGGIDLQGLAATGRMSSMLSYDGLTVPGGQLPPWSMDFVPTSLSLAVGVDGFHAGEAATEAVNDFDPKADKGLTPEQTAKIRHLFWPEAGGTVTLAPSRLTSKLLDLKLEGRATLGPTPNGQVTVTGTGLDKAIAALQAASGTDPGAGQMLGPLVLAKNLGKAQPDGSLVWVIAAGGNAPVTVNGAPLQ